MASQLGAAPVEGGVVKPIWFTEVSTAAAFEGNAKGRRRSAGASAEARCAEKKRIGRFLES
jgi:hypothetical protein